MKSVNKTSSFVSFMYEQIEFLRGRNCFGTANNYERSLKSFTIFLGGVDISFEAITDVVIEAYNTYLIKRGVSRNSISFYMRILRAVYNKAVKQKVAKDRKPFRNVYTGVDKTKKRAVDESVISEIYKIDLSCDYDMSLARDMFIFSYLTRGMAFVDVAFLTNKSVRNGRIIYRRRKTGQLLDIKIEECIEAIIDRYKDKSKMYVFPIITHEDHESAYKQYRNAINKYNILLKRLSERLSKPAQLTSYVSRHTWATSARKHNIPISIISAGLGHSNETTTEIYLSSIENSLIDKANEDIISTITKRFL